MRRSPAAGARLRPGCGQLGRRPDCGPQDRAVALLLPLINDPQPSTTLLRAMLVSRLLRLRYRFVLSG
jgi:hypothetical protein